MPIRKTAPLGALAIALAASLALSAPAAAQDCSSSVLAAQDNIRNTFIQGMSGLISNNFSSRPASFASMGCLDQFMQGNMDIMFKPPALNDILGSVMNFACQAASQAASSGGTPTDFSGLIGSLSGGLNLNSGSGSTSSVNLTSVLSGMSTSTTAPAASSAGSGIVGLYSMPGQ